VCQKAQTSFSKSLLTFLAAKRLGKTAEKTALQSGASYTHSSINTQTPSGRPKGEARIYMFTRLSAFFVN
jgi:hypothetical protein